MLNDKVVLVTGGTGTFGQAFAAHVFANYRVRKLIVFSRDEFKQHEMGKRFPEAKFPVRYFIGDIRDPERLRRAFHRVDCVIHAAAMKHVPACEYNPFEAIRTNIHGAQHISEAAIDAGVKRIVALSTDKAVSPVNLYGATKLAMEKIFVAAGSYVGERDTRFSLVRYGNVIGSRGSVIPFFQQIAARGEHEYPVTDERMTRFWIEIGEGVALVMRALAEARGGETFIPKIASTRITDLVRAIDPAGKVRIVGIRPGEKLHETLVSEDEARNTIDAGEHYVILPPFSPREEIADHYRGIPRLPEGFSYRSDNNGRWMSDEEIRASLVPAA